MYVESVNPAYQLELLKNDAQLPYDLLLLADEKRYAIARATGYGRLIVGTADCGVDQIRFYERNGFVKYGVKKDFFVYNYEESIIENGVRLRDMVMLQQDI